MDWSKVSLLLELNFRMQEGVLVCSAGNGGFLLFTAQLTHFSHGSLDIKGPSQVSIGTVQ